MSVGSVAGDIVVGWTKSMDNLKGDEQKFEYNP